jgi:peptidoglycan/xylan/chitin deacetylase (PgdA/CDA1 family)
MSRVARIALLIVIGLSLASLAARPAAFATGQLPPVDATPTSRARLAPARTPTATATPRPLPELVRVPVLMYHYISVPPPSADRIRVDLSVTPHNFERQLQFLKANGYATVSLADVHAYLSQGKPLPPRAIVLTFDDGYLDAYRNAFPLLKKYGMCGTFFITTDFINYRNPEHLTWKMVREMADAGMSIESHARTHRDLRNRNNAFLVWEILGPVEQIAHYAGKRPRFFAYPSGRYSPDVQRILRDVGTLGAVTTEHGSTYTLANAMTWPRLRVHNSTSIDAFARLVAP